MNSIDGFLGEIRGLALRSLDPERVGEVLDEVRAHLDASVQARLELGQNREEAERDSLKSFGTVEEFVQTMAVCHPPARVEWFDRGVAKATLCAIVFFSVFLGVAAEHESPRILFLAIAIAGTIGFLGWIAKASWRVATPQFAPLFAAYLLGIPLGAAMISIDHIADDSGMASLGMTRVAAQRDLEQARLRVAGAETLRKDFQAAVDRYYFKPRGPPTKVMWYPSWDSRKLSTFRVFPANSPEEAAASWQKVLPKAYANIEEQRITTGHMYVYLDEAVGKSYAWNVVHHLPAWESFSRQIVALMGMASLLPWWLNQRKRRRQNRAMRA